MEATAAGPATGGLSTGPTKGRRVDALKWLRAVQRRSSLSAKARAVAAVLFARMDPDGASCFPSLDTIAADAGYRGRESILSRSASKGRKAQAGPLDELEQAGWILRERRPRRGHGHATTKYYATIPIDDRPSAHLVSEGAEVPDDVEQQVPDVVEQQVPDDVEHDLASDLASDLATKVKNIMSDVPSGRSDAPPRNSFEVAEMGDPHGWPLDDDLDDQRWQPPAYASEVAT